MCSSPSIATYSVRLAGSPKLANASWRLAARLANSLAARFADRRALPRSPALPTAEAFRAPSTPRLVPCRSEPPQPSKHSATTPATRINVLCRLMSLVSPFRRLDSIPDSLAQSHFGPVRLLVCSSTTRQAPLTQANSLRTPRTLPAIRPRCLGHIWVHFPLPPILPAPEQLGTAPARTAIPRIRGS